ncbi:MAG: T9SS type A sorting domain-containing protein [Bacteroidetes bacterium]|nr:T9SS type A sorting domain-containing protein [Bacteroidota bacterium]
MVYDMQGKIVHSEPLKILNGYYTRDLSMIGMADGVYLIVSRDGTGAVGEKMVIE